MLSVNSPRFGKILVDVVSAKQRHKKDEVGLNFQLSGKDRKTFAPLLNFVNSKANLDNGTVQLWTWFPGGEKMGFSVNHFNSIGGRLNISRREKSRVADLIKKAPLGKATQDFLLESLKAHTTNS